LVLFLACFFLIFSFSLLNRRVFSLVVEFRNQDRSKVFSFFSFSLFFCFPFFPLFFLLASLKLFKSFRQNSRIVVQTLCVSQTEIGACFGNGEINFSMK